MLEPKIMRYSRTSRIIGFLGASTGSFAAAPSLAADTYTFTLNAAQSNLTATMSASAQFTETFIWNYDPASNPRGNQDVPGPLRLQQPPPHRLHRRLHSRR